MAGDKLDVPQEWEDDQRMAVMFSPFRDRRVNTKSWDKKIDFWKNVIQNSYRKKNAVSFDAKDLPDVFARKGKRPVCLNTVLQELLREGKIQPVEEFLESAASSWLGWGFQWLVKKPVKWAFSSLWGRGQSSLAGEYVILDLLQEKSETLLQKMKDDPHIASDGVIQYSALWKKSQDLCDSKQTLDLVLYQLQKQGKVSVCGTEQGSKLVKFAGASNLKSNDLTEVDVQIQRLRKVEGVLQNEIKELIYKRSKCRLDAKFYLNQGLKKSALNQLKRRKVLEGLMQKRETALDNVQQILQQLRDVDTNRMILDAYRAGSVAYKEAISKYGLTPDNIDKVMLDVEETLDTQADIDSALASGPAGTDDASTEELERELELLLDDKAAQSPSKVRPSAQVTPQLPQVPTFEPSPPKVNMRGDQSTLNSQSAMRGDQSTLNSQSVMRGYQSTLNSQSAMRGDQSMLNSQSALLNVTPHLSSEYKQDNSGRSTISGDHPIGSLHNPASHFGVSSPPQFSVPSSASYGTGGVSPPYHQQYDTRGVSPPYHQQYDTRGVSPPYHQQYGQSPVQASLSPDSFSPTAGFSAASAHQPVPMEVDDIFPDVPTYDPTTPPRPANRDAHRHWLTE